MKERTRSEQVIWEADTASAIAEWVIVREETWPEDRALPRRGVQFVETMSDTGSRYVVVATPLGPLGRSSCGGPTLVTVYSPWRDCWALQDSGLLASSYVAEHLTTVSPSPSHIHGGDLAALTLTVAHALGREAVMDY